MKRTVVFSTAFLLSATVWGQAAGARSGSAATASSAGKVGIIDIRGAITDTADAKKQLTDLQARFQPKRVELENKSRALQNEQQQLKDGGNTLSDEAKAELQQKIQRDQRDLNTAAEAAQSDFQTDQNDIAQKILEKMTPLINSYAKEHGYTLIVERSAVVFADNAADITPDIVKEYDQKFPVTASAGAPAALVPGTPATADNTRSGSAATAPPR
jgi:outer membrane protein